MPFKMKYKNLKEIVGELQNASKMHKKQAEKIDNYIDEMESNNSPSKKRGLWDNIHAKRQRIKEGSGESMRKPGSKGAPSKQDLIDSATKFHEPGHVPREAKKEIKKEEKKDPKTIEKIKKIEAKYTRKEILNNEGESQDKLRKLYEKLYPGEEYIP